MPKHMALLSLLPCPNFSSLIDKDQSRPSQENERKNKRRKGRQNEGRKGKEEGRPGRERAAGAHLHCDVASPRGNALAGLVVAEARAALEDHAGGDVGVLDPVGVLLVDVHQHFPRLTAALVEHLHEGHHCGRPEKKGGKGRNVESRNNVAAYIVKTRHSLHQKTRRAYEK